MNDPSHLQARPHSTARAYQPLRRKAVVVQALFAAYLALAGVGLASNVTAWLFASGRATDADDGAFSASFDRTSALLTIDIAAYLVLGIAFIAWMLQAYENIPALAGTRRYSSGWVIGGWFVPFLSLIRPKQVMDDIWRASDPEPSLPSPGVSPLVHWWWGLFLIGQNARWISDASVAPELALAGAAAWAIQLGAGLLAYILVGSVTRRQAERSRSLSAPGTVAWHQDPIGARTGFNRAAVGGVALLPLISAAVGLGLFGPGSPTFDSPGSPTFDSPGSPTFDSPGSPTFDSGDAVERVGWLRPGDCHLIPGGTEAESIEYLDRVSCDQPHDLEIVGLSSFPGGALAPYPGATALHRYSIIHCRSKYEVYTGHAAEASRLVVASIAPSESRWRDGDRSMICYAEDPSGPMTQRLPRVEGRTRTALEDLRKGDCVMWPSDYHTVEVVDCSTPHDVEILDKSTLPGAPGDPYPGSATIQRIGAEQCASHPDSHWTGPSEQTWSAGDRLVLCYQADPISPIGSTV